MEINDKLLICFDRVHEPVLTVLDDAKRLHVFKGEEAVDIYRKLICVSVYETLPVQTQDCFVCVFENVIVKEGMFLMTRKCLLKGIEYVNSFRGEKAHELYNQLMKGSIVNDVSI